jgi:OOP family OmpA-OmpF porin
MRPLKWMLGIAAVVVSGSAVAGEASAGAAPAYSATACSAGRLAGAHPTGQDADRDGVVDSDDWCLQTAAGRKVGPDGCAAGEVDVGCAKAPAAPAAKVVPVVMAARDSDRDGVEDDDDKCPGTPRNTTVDNKGCAVIEKVVLKGVNFATGSATLKPEAFDSLRSVASAMKANEDLEVRIDGYTDSIGDEQKNRSLSERRAQSVKEFLVKEGIDADRLDTKGHGEDDPVDNNDTPAGRANNRRVSFKVTDS